MNQFNAAPSLLRRISQASRALVSLAFGLAITAGFFLLLPLLQTVGRPPEKNEIRAIGTAALPPPPAAEEEPPPVEEEQKPPPPPELTESAPPMDLAQLELALDAGGTGWGGGVGDVLARLPGTREHMAGAADDGDQVFSLADLDQPPKVVHQPAPDFPAELRRRKTEGSVHVLFIVDRSGRVESPIVQKSSHPALEQPALQAVRRWRFEPGRRQGQPVPFRMRVPISFMNR